jgi:hypothetical protein
MTRSRDVADTQDNLGGAVAPFVAGKNKLINGDLYWAQRGTSGTFNGFGGYCLDRWLTSSGVGGVLNWSQQTFAPGQTEVSGNPTYFLRLNFTTSGTTPAFFEQHIESVGTFAGQTITWSFWGRVSSGTKQITPRFVQDFGTGGSSTVVLSFTNAVTFTTTWQRFSVTGVVPSISGKTVGANSYLRLDLFVGATDILTYDLANSQAEAGSVMTPFQTASGSIGGELALCQRYYYRVGGDTVYATIGSGTASTTTLAQIDVVLRPTMRAIPTVLDFSTIAIQAHGASGVIAITNCIFPSNYVNKTMVTLEVTVASGLVAGTWYRLLTNNSLSGYIGVGAEL